MREHAAQAIADIAEKEPEILDPKELTHEFSRLEQMGDKSSSKYIADALSKAQQTERAKRYKYGL